MRQTIESLETLQKQVNSSENVSIFGKRFTNDFFIVMNRISKGIPTQRQTLTSTDWVFYGISFADKRRKGFKFRIKFLKRMSENDRWIANEVVRTTVNNFKKEYPNPCATGDVELFASTVSMCRTIENTFQGD